MIIQEAISYTINAEINLALYAKIPASALAVWKLALLGDFCNFLWQVVHTIKTHMVWYMPSTANILKHLIHVFS